MMKVVADAEMLDEVLSGIETAVYSGVIIFDSEKEEMHITVADAATVQLIDLAVPSSSFEEFDIEIEKHENYQEDEEREAIFVGINFETLYSVIDELSGEVELSIDENKLVVKDEDNKFSITTNTVDLEDDVPPFDTDAMDLEVSFELDLEDLRDIRKKASLISDEAFFKIEPDEERVIAHNSSNTNELQTKFDIEKVEGDGCESRFPLEYLKDVEKYLRGLSSSDGVVSVKTGDTKPIAFKVETDREKLETVIAPRLDGPEA